MTFSLKQLQDENREWVAKNFAKDRPGWHPLLGMFEEIGELSEASFNLSTTEEEGSCASVRDAAADIVVYMADFANMHDFNLEEIVKVPNPEVVNYPEIVVGKLAHAYLKSAQGIRGNVEKHRNTMKECLRDIYKMAELEVSEVTSDSFIEVIEKVWVVVRARDWTKNKATGEVTP